MLFPQNGKYIDQIMSNMQIALDRSTCSIIHFPTGIINAVSSRTGMNSIGPIPEMQQAFFSLEIERNQVQLDFRLSPIMTAAPH